MRARHTAAAVLTVAGCLVFLSGGVAAAVVPAVEGESASMVTRTGATLTAFVNPEAENTFCLGFQYVTAESFASEEYAAATDVLCEPEFIGSGEVGESVTGVVSTLSANTLYHFRVLTENASGAADGVDQTFMTLPEPPLAETGSPEVVTSTGATVAGMITPGSKGPNSDTTYVFQYGPTESYGFETAVQDAGEGNIARAVSTTLSGLEHGTVYHYRVIATNATHTETPATTYGEDKVFTTVATPPALGSVSITEVGQDTVTLSVSLDPHGVSTRYELELGLSRGALQEVTVGDTASAQQLTLNSASLTPGTTYFYKVVASSPNGVAESAEGTFITASAAATAPLEQPATPPQLAVPAIAFPGAPTVGHQAGKPVTNAQKLMKALRACRKGARKRRHVCERKARRRYAARVKY